VLRIAFTLAGVFLAVSAVTAQTQETQSTSPDPIPAASFSQAYCAGFIADTSVPHDLIVLGGADDAFDSVVRQFTEGESIFISQRNGGDIVLGTQFSVVRPANDLFEIMHYEGERGDIRKLGEPYSDVAQVKVTHVSPVGVVAEITFSCEAVVPGDILVPLVLNTMPYYTVSDPLDHFAPLDKSKTHGRIIASRNNLGSFGKGTVVYLNLGDEEAQEGQRFRIYKAPPAEATGARTRHPVLPETVGEAVVLSVNSKSSVAIVVSSYREIAAGDYVEAD
jgi:hypothetical protein